MRLSAIRQREANWEVSIWCLGVKEVRVSASIQDYEKCKCKVIAIAAACHIGEYQANQWPGVK